MTSSETPTNGRCSKCPLAKLHLNTIEMDTETRKQLLDDAGVKDDDTPEEKAAKILKLFGNEAELDELEELNNALAKHHALYTLLVLGCAGPSVTITDGITVTKCKSPQQSDSYLRV